MLRLPLTVLPLFFKLTTFINLRPHISNRFPLLLYPLLNPYDPSTSSSCHFHLFITPNLPSFLSRAQFHLMRTIREPHHRPPLLLAVLMSEPPEKEAHLSSSSSTQSPPSSLPSSPNPSHPSSPHPHRSSTVSPCITDALLHQLTADQYCDDGVELVMDVLTNEKAIPAPLPPANVDRLVTSWKTADWGAKKTSRCVVQKFLQKDSFPKCRPRSITETKCPKPREWTHSEDCTLADVFTRIRPERQKGELQKRLPKRSWTEAQRRYEIVCDRVCANDDLETDRKGGSYRRGFWRRQPKGNLKPECFISKTLSKLR